MKPVSELVNHQLCNSNFQLEIDLPEEEEEREEERGEERGDKREEFIRGKRESINFTLAHLHIYLDEFKLL